MPLTSCRKVHSWENGAEQFQVFMNNRKSPPTTWIESSQDGGRTWKRETLDPGSIIGRALYGLVMEAADKGPRRKGAF